MLSSSIDQDIIFSYGMMAALWQMLFLVGYSETTTPAFCSPPSGGSAGSTNRVNVPSLPPYRLSPVLFLSHRHQPPSTQAKHQDLTRDALSPPNPRPS